MKHTAAYGKNTVVKAAFLFIFLVLLTNGVSAKWYLFGGPGIAYYQGDVAETGFPNIKMLKFNGKLGVGYNFYKRWDVRFHGSYGNLHGSDSYTNDVGKNLRGITFNTRVIDAGLTLKYRNFFKKSKYINYAFIGFDYMNMTVNRNVVGTGAAIIEKSFSSTQFNIPIGFGVGKWLSRHWGAVFEFSYHYALTDYLDGTSLAGNSKALDSFIAGHVMLVYRFTAGSGGSGGSGGGNLKVDCPTF